MSDLINREDAINAIYHAFPQISMERATEILHECETERETGIWVRENIVLTSYPPKYQWHCSECGKMVHWFTTEVLTKYCPNCGARMERREE